MNTPHLLSLVAGTTLTLATFSTSAESLKDRQWHINALIPKVQPTVVEIHGVGRRVMGSGSGVIVSKDGLILTATHVVDAVEKGNAKDDDMAEDGQVSITLPDGREVKGKVLGRDRTRDAAMVQITDVGTWPFAELAPADSVEQGEWCIAMGHPGGFDGQRGIPVRVGRLWQANEKAFYRSDCTVSGGDSGGPLFDLEGRVIGIHSSISMNVSENRHVPIGVFHDDWTRLKKGDTWGNPGKVLSGSEDLSDKSKPKTQGKKGSEPLAKRETESADPVPAPAKARVRLGLQMGITEEGAPRVTEVIDDSPAAKAGFELGDIILKIDGKSMGSTGDVSNRIRAASPGDKVKFTVQRKDKEQELAVTLEAAK